MVKVKEEALVKEDEVKRLKFITKKAVDYHKRDINQDSSVLIRIPSELLAEIDKDVSYEIEGTRSAWFRDAFKEKLKRSKRNQNDKS